MVIKPFSQIIDPAKVFEIQKKQYRETILLTDTVPAGQSKVGQVSISNLGHFFSMFMTGSFETLTMPVAAIVDSGVNYISGQLIDAAGNKKLFNDRIPLNILLSPGRRKSANSTTVLTTDPPGNSLFYPMELEYLWSANSTILMDVLNQSNTPITYEIAFHGIRIVTAAGCPQ